MTMTTVDSVQTRDASCGSEPIERIAKCLTSQAHRHFSLHLTKIGMFCAGNATPSISDYARARADVEFCLRSMVPTKDAVVALGDDRFAVLQFLDGASLSPQEFAARICAEFAQSTFNSLRPIELTCNVGTVTHAGPTESISMLMNRGDRALLASMHQGVNNFFLEELDLQTLGRGFPLPEAELKLALDLQQFELFYQPIINTATCMVVKYEALIRWHHPIIGLVAPDRFIPTAERSGLIVEIGAWVLETACREICSQPENIGVSVNVSAAEFNRSDVSSTIEAALNKSGLHPSRLCIEITETVMMQVSENILWQIDKIREMGVSIYLDDFGTGYSSLASIHSLPLRGIKIDRAFAKNISVDQKSKVILAAIISLAKDLGMTTVAEGIENESDVALMRHMGATYLQGYHLGLPAPAPVAFMTASNPDLGKEVGAG